MPRLTKIFTKRGDTGFTSLSGNTVVSKSNATVCVIGDIDELNSYIGFVLAVDDMFKELSTASINILKKIQQKLFDIGGELSLPSVQNSKITQDDINELQTILEILNEQLPPLKEFIIPGGNLTSANLHIARTVCRRAERQLVHANNTIGVSVPNHVTYLNRLSDFLFVLARTCNTKDEIQWNNPYTSRSQEPDC